MCPSQPPCVTTRPRQRPLDAMSVLLVLLWAAQACAAATVEVANPAQLRAAVANPGVELAYLTGEARKHKRGGSPRGSLLHTQLPSPEMQGTSDSGPPLRIKAPRRCNWPPTRVSPSPARQVGCVPRATIVTLGSWPTGW